MLLHLSSFLLLMSLLTPAYATELAGDLSDEEWERLETVDTSHVNEGELSFLETLPDDRDYHHHQNVLTLRADSLKTGWVSFRQCHDHLDAVPKLAVVFRPKKTRALKITETRNIEDAQVMGHSVELTNIGKAARLCLSGQLRLIEGGPTAGYTLTSGPYMRRFLDGFYPMRVSLEVDPAQSGIGVVSVSPNAQPGFSIRQQAERTRIHAQFEGRLVIRLGLAAHSSQDQQ